MGTEYRIYDPALEVNNKATLVVPNSIKTENGLGETKVENFSRGNGNYVTVVSTDVTTMVGVVKFDIPTTVEGKKQLDGWKRNNGKNFIQFTGSANGKTYTEYYQDMSVVNKIEAEWGVDGKVSVEFNGGAAQ